MNFEIYYALFRQKEFYQINFSSVKMDKGKQEKANAYWKENLTYLVILLSIWFLVSYGAGIIFKDFLDNFFLAGFPLGFWFAQQGSIYIFVVLIFVYVWLMNRLDKKYGYDL